MTVGGFVRVRMDPRIRRRRVEVLRSEGRRRLRNLLAALGVVVLAAGAVGAMRSPLFDVDYVDVQGAEHTPRKALLRATRLDGHPQLIDVRTTEVARRARGLPWVAEAEAEKVWPHTVRIRVVERVAVAAAPAHGGGWAVLDSGGRVLAVQPAQPAGMTVRGLPPVPRPGGTVADPGGLLQVATAVPVHLQDRLVEVLATAEGEVELRLLPSAIVRLGPPVDLPAKLRALETMMAKVDLRRLAVLDVRVPTAPVLIRR